jgi:sulfur carrier protein
MEIKLNGKLENIRNNLTVVDLLQEKEIKNIEMVTVQLNGAFVKKENLHSITITENDEIDFLYFMGGGSESFAPNHRYRCQHQ